MSTVPPSIKLPSITGNDDIIISIFRNNKINPNADTISKTHEFLDHVDYTIQFFNYTHHIDNEKTIRGYNDAVKNTIKNTNGQISKVTAMTLHTQKGDITFHRNTLSSWMFKTLLAGPKPSMTWKQQSAYLRSDSIVLKKYSMSDRDQLFRLVVEDANNLGQYLFMTLVGIKDKQRKTLIKKIIIELINKYFPDITKNVKEDAVNKTFKTHLYPVLRELTTH